MTLARKVNQCLQACRPYVAFVMQINYISLRNTTLTMATSIVYSCQLRYNLRDINKSVMRPLHIIGL